MTSPVRCTRVSNRAEYVISTGMRARSTTTTLDGTPIYTQVHTKMVLVLLYNPTYESRVH